MEVVAIVFGVLVIALGLYFLLAPYENLVANLPKKKSRRNISIRGGIIVTCGALLIILQIVTLLIW